MSDLEIFLAVLVFWLLWVIGGLVALLAAYSMYRDKGADNKYLDERYFTLIMFVGPLSVFLIGNAYENED